MKDRAINRKYNGYQRRLVSMVYKFFWQKKVSEASKWRAGPTITQEIN